MCSIIPYLLSLFCSFNIYTIQDKEEPSGIYILKHLARKDRTDKLRKIFPDDTVFYYKSYAVERITSSDQLVVNNNISRTEKLNSYYVIDLNKRKFFRIDSLSEIGKIKNPVWSPLDKKPLGIQFYYPYYDGEKYERKDTLINNFKYTKINYISDKVDIHQGCQITLYLVPGARYPVFSPKIEEAFQGKLNTMVVIYPNNKGEVVLTWEYVKVDKKYFMHDLIKRIIEKWN